MTAPLLTSHQAAAYLQIHPDTLRRWTAEGRLRALRAGRRLRYRPDDLDVFLAAPSGAGQTQTWEVQMAGLPHAGQRLALLPAMRRRRA